MKFPQDIKAVILDMDGTLLNTEPLHAEAIEEVLAQGGYKLSAHEIEKRFYGVSDTEVHAALASNVPFDLNTFLQKKNALIKELIQKYPKEEFKKLLTPGVLTFIGELQKKNIPLALVSASENEVIEAIISHLELKQSFAFFISRQHTHLTKPHSSPYFLALRLLKVRVEEALIFEDSPSGLLAALGTGAQVIQVTTFSPPLKEQVSLSIDNFSSITF